MHAQSWPKSFGLSVTCAIPRARSRRLGASTHAASLTGTHARPQVMGRHSTAYTRATRTHRHSAQKTLRSTDVGAPDGRCPIVGIAVPGRPACAAFRPSCQSGACAVMTGDSASASLVDTPSVPTPDRTRSLIPAYSRRRYSPDAYGVSRGLDEGLHKYHTPLYKKAPHDLTVRNRSRSAAPDTHTTVHLSPSSACAIRASAVRR